MVDRAGFDPVTNGLKVDRYAKFATEHLAVAASRIETGRGSNVGQFPHVSPTVSKTKRA